MFIVGTIIALGGLLTLITSKDYDSGWKISFAIIFTMFGLLMMGVGTREDIINARDARRTECVEHGGNHIDSRIGCLKVDETTGVGVRIYLPSENIL